MKKLRILAFGWAFGFEVADFPVLLLKSSFVCFGFEAEEGREEREGIAFVTMTADPAESVAGFVAKVEVERDSGGEGRRPTDGATR